MLTARIAWSPLPGSAPSKLFMQISKLVAALIVRKCLKIHVVFPFLTWPLFQMPLIADRSCHLVKYSSTSTSSCTIAGLLTGFGLAFLAEQLSGPTVDRTTLQLVGVLLSSILLPGLARALVTQHQIGKGACCS
eukprot:820017-Amphidinium_carterae.1